MKAVRVFAPKMNSFFATGKKSNHGLKSWPGHEYIASHVHIFMNSYNHEYMNI